jgi:hypothetical protein
MKIRWRVDARRSKSRPLWYGCRGRGVGSGDAKVSESPEETRKREKIQQQLDEALEDSFPASDPVSIVTSNEEEDWGTEPKAPSPDTSKNP